MILVRDPLSVHRDILTAQNAGSAPECPPCAIQAWFT